MAKLTKQEQQMFSKYYGQDNLVDNELFWRDAFEAYQNTNVPMPLKYNPITVRRVLDMLICPAGLCADCCHYPKVPITPIDFKRILDNTEYTEGQLRQFTHFDGEAGYIISDGDCPFLYDKACCIHKWRPDACYLFPIQFPQRSIMAGKEIQQMVVRIKCRESMKIVRHFLTEAVMTGKMILLPDLSLIERGICQ